MDKVRFGIIGLGNMGTAHITNFNDGKIANGVVSAVCDIDEKMLDNGVKLAGEGVKAFTDAEEMMKSGEVDAVLIATPHYLHPVLAIKALNFGLHTLVEKPAGVYTKAVREMNEVASKSDKVFGMMFNQRTNPLYIKLKKMIEDGELGELRRVNWIITNWYRTQSYYDSGSWRATWEGEGGGVLLNQSPHQIDLVQWLCGMPTKVMGHCAYGKYHDIEVEDDVTAYLEFPNGATGVFITTTGDAPGSNRLEISGTRGKVVVDLSHGAGTEDKFMFYRAETDVDEHIKTCESGFQQPDYWNCEIEVKGENPQHVGICKNFCDAILNGTPLLAPGEEGINGVAISNAIHLSDWLEKPVTLPIDEELFYTMLQDKIKNSTVKKKAVENNGPVNLSGTY